MDHFQISSNIVNQFQLSLLHDKKTLCHVSRTYLGNIRIMCNCKHGECDLRSPPASLHSSLLPLIPYSFSHVSFPSSPSTSSSFLLLLVYLGLLHPLSVVLLLFSPLPFLFFPCRFFAMLHKC